MGALPRGQGDIRDAPSPRYRPPNQVNTTSLLGLLASTGRHGLEDKQPDLLRRSSQPMPDMPVYYAGTLALLSRTCVSIVGTRRVSNAGAARARRLARELIEAGIVIVSGLAKGVDTAAHTSALEAGGSTVAVIGTPLDKVSPVENARLQEELYEKHLLLSPFRSGEEVFKGNFPKRNRVMAAISDATVIVEASDTSGTLHQAAECRRLGRWLFILRAVVDDPSVTWPARFLKEPRTIILDRTEQITNSIASR